MLDKIQFEDKVSISVDPTIDKKNKITSSDINEIKAVVNGAVQKINDGGAGVTLEQNLNSNSQTTVPSVSATRSAVEGHTLYTSNGNAGSLTLNDSYINYKKIGIYAKHKTLSVGSYVEFETEKTNKAGLITVNTSSGVITVYNTTVTFSGNGVTQTGGAIAFNSGGIPGFNDSNNENMIYKIVGFDY